MPGAPWARGAKGPGPLVRGPLANLFVTSLGTTAPDAQIIEGETAPLLVIGVATGYFAPAGDATMVDQLTGPYTALPVIVFSWTRQTQAEFADTLAPAAIIVLLVVLFILNGVAIWLRNRTEKKW